METSTGERPDFEEKLRDFISICQAIVDADWKRNGYTHAKPPMISACPGGKRYVRLISRDNGGERESGYAYCFVDRTTGDILKADGYKKPHPRPRGNIYSGAPGEAVTAHGANYIRG